MTLFERFKVIDVDTHITEPADTWTSRVSARWGDAVPHDRAQSTATTSGCIDGQALGQARQYRDGRLRRGCRTGPPPTTTCTPRRRTRRPAWPSWTSSRSMRRCSTRTSGDSAPGLARLRRPGVRVGVRAGLQRLPDRLRLGRPRPAAADRLAAVLGRRASPSPRSSDASPPATGASTSAISPRPTASRSSGTSTGTRYGPAARDAGVPVNFHIGGGRIGEQITSGVEMGLRANFSPGLVAAVRRQPALHRRLDPRRGLPPISRL